jgi:coenzyme F420-reducing hydrogenase gamma subunit
VSAKRKLKLAVWKFASCDGCQLTVLDCEAVLRGAFDIAYFPEATSARIRGRYDVSLVEGSISTAHDAERIREVRRSSNFVVAIGACATAGGVQALRNGLEHEAFKRAVYARPEYVDSLANSTPLAEHVAVDFELRGCPIDGRQLEHVLSALVDGRRPAISGHSVCLECKLAGNVCVTVAQGTPCLGPITQAGCGALCPRHSRGCYGCFGPQDTAAGRSPSLYLAFDSRGASFARRDER